MKFTQIALTVLLSAAVAFGVVKYAVPAATSATHKETAYERVMRTGVLRCAYAPYPEFMSKDVTTNKLSGFYYDVMEEIGKRLSLKIEWTEEVGFGVAFEGLKTNRYDAVCINLSATPGRARAAEFTHPILFAPYYAYARANDTRFDGALSKINDPAITAVILEGELGQAVKEEDFPKAQMLSLPNFTDVSQSFVNVAMGKADITMAEPQAGDVYMAHNPGKIKRIESAPLRMQSIGISVGTGEEALKSLLNTTIDSLHSTGYIERLFTSGPKNKELYFFPSTPWKKAGV
ncbi:MAG: transporter substrate-binding domain-containing protein [Bdellovibrionales bacterium]|jgi:ABC-type amino acid transport substrate-binding protein